MAVLGLRFCVRVTIAASLVAEHRLQTCRLSSFGSWAQLLHGMWDLPRPGLEPVSPALAGRFSTTVPPGKPFFLTFCVVLPTHLALVLKRPDFNHCYKYLWISFLMVLEPASHMSSFVVFPCLTLAVNITNDTGSSFGHTTFCMMDLASCLPQHGQRWLQQLQTSHSNLLCLEECLCLYKSKEDSPTSYINRIAFSSQWSELNCWTNSETSHLGEEWNCHDRLY